MVEVFKTNVTKQEHANMLIGLIHKSFPHFTANFDLQDCDHILRIKSFKGVPEPAPVIELFKDFGFTAEVLPDELPNTHSQILSNDFAE